MGAGPSRLASRGRAPADSLLRGLICARRAGGCNSDRRFHHQAGKDPNPARPRLSVTLRSRPATTPVPPFRFHPHTQLCSCLSLYPTIRHPTPGVHLSPGRSPEPLAPKPSGPPCLLSPGLLSFSLRVSRRVRLTVGSPPI